MPPRLAIVGAGLGGLTLARMLHLKGVAATVFDRDGSATERSYGGTLDLHADTGLYAVEQAGLLEEFRTLARYEDQGLRLVGKDGELLFESNEGNRPEIDRGQLRDMLLRSLPPGAVRWGHALDEARPIETGGAELVFRNGVVERFGLVVGADGAWSRVRPLVSDARPFYTGLTFFEMGIDDVDSRFPKVGELVASGLLIATADRKLLLAQRNAGGHMRVYAALRENEADVIGDGARLAAATRSCAEIATQYDGWAPNLVRLIGLAEEQVRSWPIYALPVGHRWPSREGGDAAWGRRPPDAPGRRRRQPRDARRGGPGRRHRRPRGLAGCGARLRDGHVRARGSSSQTGDGRAGGRVDRGQHRDDRDGDDRRRSVCLTPDGTKA